MHFYDFLNDENSLVNDMSYIKTYMKGSQDFDFEYRLNPMRLYPELYL
jgi:hypothetical protein